MVGMGRIGMAIARRLEAFGIPIAYHTRQERPDLPYRYYPNLVDMARAVDVLMVIVPGGAATRNMIDAPVLEALGPDGILVNVARGSVVDEDALIAALEQKKILAAGLDVFARRTRGARGADRDGQCRAAAARRLGLGLYPRNDGPARGGQHPGLGRRKAAADAGAGNAVAGLAATLTLSSDDA